MNQEEELGVFVVKRAEESPSPIMVTVEVEGVKLPMEVDTGVGVSIVSIETWEQHFPKLPLRESQVRLKTYTSETMAVLGEQDVSVKYGTHTERLPILWSKEKAIAF